MEIYFLDKDKVKYSEDLSDINKSRLTWIRLNQESDAEIKNLSEFTNIPPDEFEEYFESEERSRLEQGKFLELMYKVPFFDEGDYRITSVNIFIINNLFITVEKERIVPLAKMAASLKRDKMKFLLRSSVGNLLYHCLDKVNDSFLSTVDNISNITEVLEMKKDLSNQKLMKLYNYNVTLTYFNQALLANLEVLAGLRKSYFKNFDKADLELFSDLYYDNLQILDTEKIQREVITNIFNFQTVVSSYKLNRFMKRLTFLALLFMVPTLITGIFGMNVGFPPFVSEYGFVFVIGLIILIVVAFFIIFKKTDWLS